MQNSRVAEKANQSNLGARRRVSFVELRARFPYILRYAAIAGLILTIVVVGIGLWRSRGNRDFRMIGASPQLSNEVVAVVNNYERRVTEGDRLKMLVRADRETTFADGRHELDNIFVEVYGEKSEQPDRIAAKKAVYTPNADNPENFVVDFNGNVKFESRDNLNANTDQIRYDQQSEIAETASHLNFSRDNVSGSAVGAVINVKEKKLELKNQVEINVAPQGSAAKNSLTDFGNSAIKINGSQAVFDQDLARFEMSGGVHLVSTPQNAETAPTTMRAETAVYNKDTQKLDLRGAVEIVSSSENGAINVSPGKQFAPVTIRANEAIYEQGVGKVFLSGEASVEQSAEILRGNSISVDLNKNKKIEKVVSRGDGYLRMQSEARATEVSAAELFAQFDLNQQLNFAKATGEVKVKSINADNEINLIGADSLALNFKANAEKSFLEKMRTEGNTFASLVANNSLDYSRVNLSSPNSLEMLFAQQGDESVLRQMQTGGRTEVQMFAPQSQSSNPKATNKKMLADQLKLFWSSAGKDLSRAEAVGNAELYILPLQNAANVDRNSLFAARFDCVFFETGNLARSFAASGGAKAILEPTVPSNERSTRTLTAEKISADFERASQAVEIFNAVGNAKFNEQDRHGAASSFVYTANDEIVKLRGGEPTVWDSRARVKAAEIDSHTRTEVSYARGKVATTYYSQEQTGGAAPFAKVNSPVFITADRAEYSHVSGVAVYLGAARAWQDNNFVRADRLTLRRDSRSMLGEGAVQSALYTARRRENGVSQIVPVFAASDSISYRDEQKLLRYESRVDIRQATERITGGAAEVYLNGASEVERTVAENSVVITQPGRRATGDWAQYTAADETIVLRGNPATVEDAEQGASQGRQVTVFMRENRIVGQGGANRESPGRVRSTHKVKKQD